MSAMGSHNVADERRNRPQHVYQCEHCGRPFHCTTALYWHQDTHPEQPGCPTCTGLCTC